jgi:hypothetical protein
MLSQLTWQRVLSEFGTSLIDTGEQKLGRHPSGRRRHGKCSEKSHDDGLSFTLGELSRHF